MKLAYTAQSTNENYFYVFNRGDGGGYVIVAAEDRANEILGYTDNGTFDYNNIPENMKWWLGEYEKEIKYLTEHPDIEILTANTETSNTEVSPLLGATAWNQGYPYNNQCPMYDTERRCATGCVATAMAQIMYYHQWPSKGKGAYSYTTTINGEDKVLSADFESTTYEWDKMTSIYNNNSSQESKDAIATLMSHCGISLDMMYGLESGTPSIKIPYALYTYFGYDKAMTYKSRDYYGLAEWENIIRDELNAGRVVQYNGQATDGGHSFVCDGYNKDGYFHINWGWGGVSNGYFRTTALNPGTQGTGGSEGGFNRSQGMTTGIQKAVNSIKESYEICADSGMLPSTGETKKGYTITLKVDGLWNLDWDSAPIEIALVLFNANGNIVYGQNQTGPIELNSRRGWNTVNFNMTIPTSATSGSYKLYLCYRVNGTNSWKKVRVAITEPQYVDVIVDGNRVLFTQSSTGLNNTAIIESRVYPNPVTDFVTVKNEKTIRRIRIYSVLGNLVSDVPIGDSNSTTIDLSSLSAGNYLLVAITDGGSSVNRIIKK